MHTLCRLVLPTCVSVGSNTWAQTAQPRAEETVTLSEFTVTGTADDSYVASESIGGFYIDRIGVTVTEVDASGQPVDTNAGNQNAKGLELDFTWRVTNDLTLLGGYGYVNARIVSSGRDLEAVGRRPNKIPETNFGLALKYNLPGALKGAYVNAGVTYTGLTFRDSTGGGITEGASSPRRGYVLTHDGRRNLSLPSYTVAELGLSYRLRPVASRFAHTVRLNVKNASIKTTSTSTRRPATSGRSS